MGNKTFSINDDRKSVIEKVKEFFWGKFFIILLFAVLSFLTCKFNKNKCSINEIISWVVVSIYLLSVLIQRHRYFRSNPNSIYEPPYTKQHKKESVAVFLIMALSLVFFIQNLEVLWFICIIIISAAILLVIRCYPKEYDPWKHPISDIKLLEIITICIAILQLVLAYPQLKNSYKSATSADIEKLRSSSKEIEDSFEGLVISSIPDSLITEEAKIAIPDSSEQCNRGVRL